MSVMKCVTSVTSVKVREELEKVRECEKYLLMAERENIEKFNKNVKAKDNSTKTTEVIQNLCSLVSQVIYF